MNFEFSTARFKHLNWKFRLRSFLDGKSLLTKKEALSHHDCELGHWLDNRGKAQYGHLPHMPELRQCHIQLHEQVHKIIELRNKGLRVEAEGAFQELNQLSDQLILLLDKTEEEAPNL
ncbi:CZB domain-containing protein [Rapidithrix thailandica]|uniref:CZB domain-containing protein n=1 Tax=Rapidithrix thailandica TaxID=413964 RepID=A0AAW9S6K2_9BACT